MRFLHIGVAFAALLASSQVAYPCGGGNETPTWHWSLDHREYLQFLYNEEKTPGLPFLSPGNDTRINLQFLMMDVHPWKLAAERPPEEQTFQQESALDASMATQFSMPDLISAFEPPGGKSAFLAEGEREATRCMSFEGGAKDFLAAVQAETALSNAEKAALVDARNRMAPTCDREAASHAASDPLAGVDHPSPVARDFASYLAGAKSFYDGDFDAAIAGFKTAGQSPDAWLKEAATYMVARAMLNKAQAGAFERLNGVREPKVADAASVDALESALKAYLDAYPDGRYRASARGLLRRAYWLAGDKERLGGEYSWLMRHVGSRDVNVNGEDLVREVDAKYLDAEGNGLNSRDPILLAVEDLRRMRGPDDQGSSKGSKPTFPAAVLDAQAPRFSGDDALFGFLKAARAYYADGDTRAALEMLGPEPSEAPSPPYVGFSREMLRGQALMAEGRNADAIAHWRQMLPWAAQPWQREAVELGLAMTWERAGTVNKAFLPETRVESSRVRMILLRYVAGPILLRMSVADPAAQPDEKAMARFALLYKEATRGLYSGFLKDFSSADIPEGNKGDKMFTDLTDLSVFHWEGKTEPYRCPDLRSVVTELAGNPKSSHGQLCLGDFVRMKQLDGIEDARPSPGELGGGKSIFPGGVYSRGETYKKLIADPATPDGDRAYALFRAVNCYAPARTNTCGGEEVSPSQRKAWHDELKSRYGSTPWARSLRYYW